MKSQGIYYSVPEKEYHKSEGWSKSKLDYVNISMAHYFENEKNPKAETPLMAVGSAVHCRILTPDLYQSSIAIAPDVDKRTKIGKETWAEFIQGNVGKTIIKHSDAEDVERIAESVLTHPDASELLTNGRLEVSMQWNDEKTGLPCRARVDWLRDDHILVDLKKTGDASYFKFQKHIIDFRYHVQGAFYLEGYRRITDVFSHDFYFICVEDHAPWAVKVYRLGPQSLDVGRQEWEKNLARVFEYYAEPEIDRWAGYELGSQTIEIPGWAKQRAIV